MGRTSKLTAVAAIGLVPVATVTTQQHWNLTTPYHVRHDLHIAGIPGPHLEDDLNSYPTPFRYDGHGRPIGLDWAVLSANCPQDPSVWANASLVKPKSRGTRIPDETEMRIVRLHLDGWTAAQIAEDCDVSSVTVSAVLDRREVTENRGRGTRQRLPQETYDEVIRLYTEERLGGAGIRAALGLSHATIYKILRRHGIPTRNQRRNAA